jgi:hypothetical protein
VDQDAPSLPSTCIYHVDFEGDLVLAVLQPGAEIGVHWAVLAGAEHDAAVMQPVVDRQHGKPEPPGERDPADVLPRHELQAFRSGQRLHDRLSWRTAGIITRRHVRHEAILPAGPSS